MNDKNLEKLQNLVKMLNEVTVTPEHFEQFFKLFSQALKKIKEYTDSQRTEIENMVGKMEKGHKEKMSVLDDATKRLSGVHSMMKIMMKEVENKHEKMMSEKMEEMVSEMKTEMEKFMSQMPVMPDMEPMNKKMEDHHKEHLETIEGLKKELEEIKKEVKQKALPRGTIGGMRKIPITKRYSLTSQVDGATRAFNLPKDTVEVLGVWGTSFPITFDPADWTLSGNTLTLATAIPTPESGQSLHAIIETLFYG